MGRYWENKLFKAGAILAMVGWTPLLFIIFLGLVGILDDPNPIGPGLLFFFTFWPAVILMIIGFVRVRVQDSVRRR